MAAEINMMFLCRILTTSLPAVKPPTQKHIIEIVNGSDNCVAVHSGKITASGALNMDHA